jgi:NADH-quinone oxidoreductase subunit A
VLETASPKSKDRMQTTHYFWNYLPLLLQILAAVALGAVMVTGSFLIGRHRRTISKLETYECGIVAEGDARGRFSVRFYMVAMLFILFDVEAVFLLPWAVIYRQLHTITGSRYFGFWEMVVYLGFVVVGFWYIVKKGILDWAADRGDL